MKKIIKITSGILLFVIIFMSMFMLFISADEPQDTRCVSDHFSKLKGDASKKRVPPNVIGTCTHSAMSMLLSFYDFYWHDSFVPTVYEEDGENHQMGWENGRYNSTINKVIETINANPEASKWNEYRVAGKHFEEFSEKESDNYLQPYLMNIAQREVLSSAIGIVGMLDFQVVRVLETYLEEMGLDQYVEVHIEYGFPTASNLEASRETLFNTIKTQINNGHPVMYLGLDHIDALPDFIDGDEWGIYAHAMVAYDVVTRSGREDIVLHTGWSGDETDYYNSTLYSNVSSAIWIEIDESELQHQCTGKYLDTATGNYYCSCQIYSDHPSHYLNHVEYETIYAENGHIIKCHCGLELIVKNHSYQGAYYHSPDQHYEQCSICGQKKYVSHRLKIGESISDDEHEMICQCGHVGEAEDHYDYSCERNTTANHKAYCECGHYMGTRFHVVPAGNAFIKFCIHCGERINSKEDITPMPGLDSVTEIIYITDAGSYIDSDGVIYLVDSDMRLYLEGELDIYELAENATGYPSV